MKKNRNLIVAPCGNASSLFATHWLSDPEAREFDVCLLFYHAEINDPTLPGKVEHFYHLKDFKYKMIYNLLTNVAPQLLDEYEYFFFIDDDIAFRTADINRMFELSRTFDMSITQASLSHNSFCSWPIFKNKANCLLRYMGQVEVMAPLFSREALIKCLPSFNENKSSWGLDSVWPKILGYPRNKLGVFDAVIMEHTRPVGGGELYKKIKADPYQEWQEIIEKYDAIKDNFVEYGRLALITPEHNQPLHRLYKLNENFHKLRQRVRDYDVMSRVYNRLGMKVERQAI